MSVRQSLLAILDQGACYGYQLRTEFARRTGSRWALNVGQIYNTLERLERDGLVVKGETDQRGHVYYSITDAGSGEVAAWLAAPLARGRGTKDELAIKLAVAATLPGADVAGIIGTQRESSLAHLEQLLDDAGDSAPGEPEDLARAIVLDAMIAHARAELDWLERAEQRVRLHPDPALQLATDRPRRGRPVRAG